MFTIVQRCPSLFYYSILVIVILYNLSHLRLTCFTSLCTSLLPAVFLLLFFPHPFLLFRCISSSLVRFLFLFSFFFFIAFFSLSLASPPTSSFSPSLPLLPFADSLIFSLPLPSLLFCFFMFFSSIGRFLLCFSFFFSLLPWLFLLFSVTSFFLFIFVFVFCFLFLHLPFACDVIEVCSFFFLHLPPAPLPPVFLRDFFSLHLPLYSSAVLLFRWQFAFCSCLGGNSAYRVASLVGFMFVIFYLFAPVLFTMNWRGGGGGDSAGCLSYSIFQRVYSFVVLVCLFLLFPSSSCFHVFLQCLVCSDRILTCRIKSIRSPAKVGLVVTDLITSPVVSWEGWETPPPPPQHRGSAVILCSTTGVVRPLCSCGDLLLSSARLVYVLVDGDWNTFFSG